jgi:hypothetical protein
MRKNPSRASDARVYDEVYDVLFGNDDEWNEDTLTTIHAIISNAESSKSTPSQKISDARKKAALNSAWEIMEDAPEWDVDVLEEVSRTIRTA